MDQNQLQTHIQNNTLAQAIAELEQERGAALRREDDNAGGVINERFGGGVFVCRRRDRRGRHLRDAQALFIRAQDPAGQGRAAGNLAQLEERAGNADEAQALYMQAADLLHEGKAFGDEYKHAATARANFI